MSVSPLSDSTRGAGQILAAYGDALRSQRGDKPQREPFLHTRISHLGSQLGHLDQALNKLDDQELAASARRGLRALGSQLGEKDPDTLAALGLKLNGYKTEEPALELLRSADSLEQRRLDLSQFAKTFTRIGSLRLGGRFTQEARQIAELSGFDALRESTYRAFLQGTDGALQTGDEELDKLLERLEQAETLEQKAETLAEFDKSTSSQSTDSQSTDSQSTDS